MILPQSILPPPPPFRGFPLGIPHTKKGFLSEINTGDSLFYNKRHMDGTNEVVYHVNIIDILDRVFLKDGLKFLSPKQQRFMNQFFAEAEKINNKFESGSSNLYDEVDEVFKKLDHFLGNYKGVDENEYTR